MRVQHTGRFVRDRRGRVCEVVYVSNDSGIGEIGWISTLIQVGGSLIGGLFGGRSAQRQQAAQVANQFDAEAVRVAELFHAIQTKPAGTVTEADYQAAEAAYRNLEAAVSQYPSLGEKWNSSAYKPAYQHGLERIRGMVTGATSSPSVLQSGSQGEINPLWIVAALGAVLLFKGR